jgi:pyridoxine 5-phosphate synthase
MVELGVNIDHVATVRQARRTYEPDPVWAAAAAQLAGAECITMHLREDRRHVQDDDLVRVKAMCHVKLNMEMAATAEMVGIARKLKPHMSTLVPEGRHEVTTEGGLDVVRHAKSLRESVKKMKSVGIVVSAFIDPDLAQVAAAAAAGFDACELHTGPYAHAFLKTGGDVAREPLAGELAKLASAGDAIRAAKMRFHAGHALNYVNVYPIAALRDVKELHIGHSIVARAIFVGLRTAVIEMKRAMAGDPI